MSATIINNSLVHYEVIGRGKPLVFVHGWVGSWRYWVRAMEALSIGHRTYALDLWGFGDSDRHNGQYSVDAYATLLREFLDKLGIQQVALVGHALGGMVALRFASQSPERVGRVMGVSVPLEVAALARPVSALVGNGDALSKLVMRRLSFPELDLEARKTDSAAVHETLRRLPELDLRRDLWTFGAPVLLLYGRNDPLVKPPTDNGHSFNGIRQRVMLLDNVQHFPMLEVHNQFNRLLADFLVAGDDLSILALKEEWQRRMR